MKKLLSAMLVSALMLGCAGSALAAETDVDDAAASNDTTIVGAGTDVSESGTSGKVYFQKPDNWSGTQVYCHIYQADGDGTAFYGWQTKAEKCTDDGGGKWSYDLSVLDNSTQLDTGLGDETFNLMFSDNVSNETCPLMFNKNVIGDTYKVVDTTEKTFENPVDSTKAQWKGSWTTNAKKYGIPLMITSVGTIQGDFISKGSTVDDIITKWDSENTTYPNEQSYSKQSSARDHATRLAEIKTEMAKLVSDGKVLYVGGGTYTETSSSSSSGSSSGPSSTSTTGSSDDDTDTDTDSSDSDTDTDTDTDSSDSSSTDSSSTSLTTSDGKKVTKNADGTLTDEDGNVVSADDVVEVTTDGGTVSTGESSTYIFVTLGIMLAAAGVYVITRKKRV